MNLQHMSHTFVCQFYERVFFTINFFFTISQLLFLLQCIEHVDIKTFLCSLACTWITIIDSQLIFRCFIGMQCQIDGCLFVIHLSITGKREPVALLLLSSRCRCR